jgi:acyl-coenzyme A synthetase/AMP-(fatty) acid ligase
VALLRGDPERELELREWLRARLPGYMQPQAWVWLDSLPRNANGKYDRTLLRQRFESVSSSSFLPAGTPSDTGISG